MAHSWNGLARKRWQLSSAIGNFEGPMLKRLHLSLVHDRRYAITSEKVTNETGWSPQVEFQHGLAEAVQWYRENAAWVARVRSGEYRDYYEKNYERREAELKQL